MLAATALLATGALLRGAPMHTSMATRRAGTVQMAGAYGFSARDLKTGGTEDLAQYEGQVSLIVNVASK